MLEQIHPRVTRNTGQVEGVDATIFPVTARQPGTTVTAYMVGGAVNVIRDYDAPDLDALAEAQDVEPIGDIDELIADFWPEDERVEDFMATVRRWRDEGGHRNG
jgi:hypothetical protein